MLIGTILFQRTYLFTFTKISFINQNKAKCTSVTKSNMITLVGHLNFIYRGIDLQTDKIWEKHNKYTNKSSLPNYNDCTQCIIQVSLYNSKINNQAPSEKSLYKLHRKPPLIFLCEKYRKSMAFRFFYNLNFQNLTSYMDMMRDWFIDCHIIF